MPLADLLIATDDVARAGAQSVYLLGQAPTSNATTKNGLDQIPIVQMTTILDRINRPRQARSPQPPSSPEADRIAVKGFDLIPLSVLLALLTEQTWQESLLDEFPLVYSGGPDGPWLHTVPATLMEHLSSLDSQRIDQVAGLWSQADELIELEERQPGMTREVLDMAVNLAKRAASSRKGMYLWLSL